jgi:hypothetical protein
VSTYFLAWRDPTSRAWFPIGRLDVLGSAYEFSYVQGARDAKNHGSFEPLPMFPDLEDVYRSDELFPLFANRAPSSGRDDYFEVVEWLNLPSDARDPLAVLARSGGRKATDAFEVFPCPRPEDDGTYRVHFFVHGVSHVGEQGRLIAESLQFEERLLIMWDAQNSYDPMAIALRVDRKDPADRTIIGYCPRYLTEDWWNVVTGCEFGETIQVQVEMLNPPPTPLAFRVLCRLEGCWPPGFKPCTSEQYKSLAGESAPC